MSISRLSEMSIQPAIWMYCAQCNRCYEVQPVEFKDTSILLTEDTYPCITPLCIGRLRKYVKADNILTEILVKCRAIIPVDQDVFYQAVMGLDMQSVTEDRLSTATLGKKIVEWILDPKAPNKHRVIVDAVILEDGTRVSLAPSTHGACIFKIEEPDGNSTQGNSKGSHPDGEESGRIDAEAGQ